MGQALGYVPPGIDPALAQVALPVLLDLLEHAVEGGHEAARLVPGLDEEADPEVPRGHPA